MTTLKKNMSQCGKAAMGGVVLVAVGMMVAVVVLLVTVLVAVTVAACSPDGMRSCCTHLCQGSGQGLPLWL